MPVTLTNLQRWGPLLVPLAGGRTLRLSPGQTSEELPDVDVADNPKVDKLSRLGVLDVAPVPRPRGRSRSGDGAAEGSTKS